MQNEKMMILKMLESGKISTEEASRLLQSVDTGAAPAPPPYTPPPSTSPSSSSYASTTSSQTPPKSHAPPASSGSSGSYSSSQSNDPGKKHAEGHSILDDIGQKFDEWGPKVRKATASVAEKIAGGVDRLSKSLSDYSPSSPQPSYGGAPHPKPPSKPPGGLTEKSIEMLVEPGFSELNLSGQNGDVRIKGYNSDKISARISYKAKRAGAHIDLMKLGNKYFLKYEPDDFETVMIDAYVPDRAFGVIRIDGVNANMDCESLAAEEIAISNANGSLRAANLTATNLRAESGNGRFVASRITAETAVLENVNGVMETDELDIAQLRLNNYNGPLSLLMSNFSRYTEYMWNVETGNAKLSMNLPTLPDLGYHIKAHAAMSEIRLGLTGLQFLIHEQSLVEARSVKFDTAVRKVKMTVETSNGLLVIN